MTTAKKPTTNPLLIQAIELAHKLAGAGDGNGGVWAVLGVLLTAYRAGKVGLLARHTAGWQAEQTTGGLIELPALPPIARKFEMAAQEAVGI